jgi:TPR repeat protein
VLTLFLLAAAPAWTQTTIEPLAKTCTRGDGRACSRLLSLARPACEANVPNACFRLAALLSHSKLPGVVRDEAAGAKAVAKACALGEQPACLMQATDAIRHQRFDEASALMVKSCDAGYVPACQQVSQAFELTLGGALAADVPGLRRQCADEPRLADSACFALGRRLLPSDAVGAVAAWEKACAHWSERACHALFELYADGDAGVPHDVARAKHWIDEESRITRVAAVPFAPLMKAVDAGP